MPSSIRSSSVSPAHGEEAAEADVADRFDGANEIDDQEMLFARGWTDGLPVVIPTAEKVAAMVAASGRDAAEPIGPIPPRWRQATIEKIAINAVLAGCRPEYFPVVLAAIDALLDNDCQLYGIQTATNTTAPLLIVNGPIASEIDINARGNVFGQGARANATIGRAVQLVLRNIGGDIPGETDMSTHGQAGKFTACIAEAEDDSPWSPFHVDAGFARGRQHGHRDRRVGAAKYLHLWLRDRARTCSSISSARRWGSATTTSSFRPARCSSSAREHAATMARDGIGKKEIQNAVFERARIPLTRFAKRSVEGFTIAARAGSPKSAIRTISASRTGRRTFTSSSPAAPASIRCSCRPRSAIVR